MDTTEPDHAPKPSRIGNFVFGAIALLSLAGYLGYIAFASNGRSRTPGWDPIPEVQDRIDAIKVEIAKPGDHAWAGEYYQGDGLGSNITFWIAPKSGFAFTHTGCVGLYDENHGDVAERDGAVHTTPRLSFDSERWSPISAPLVPVRWGERRYLIPQDEIAKFCSEVNQGDEPRDGPYGRFFLRQDDWQIKVDGLPDVPKEFRKHFLAAPLNAEIIEVGESRLRPSISDFNFRDTTVTLNVGSAAGVLPGMQFQSHDAPPFLQATVTKVFEKTCEAEITQVGEEEPAPAVGVKLTTGKRNYSP